MRIQLALSNWTEKFMIQNQSKSVEELWNSFKSEIHEIRNKSVPKQLSRITSKVSCTGDGYHQRMF